MSIPRPILTWRCRDQRLELGRRTWIMGILNVTPDSFYDGGCHAAASDAVDHAQRMIEDGADIIDVGGESSRPGSVRISADAELERVMPVVHALCKQTDVLVSVDTMKARVAREVLEAGAHIINDISGLTHDPDMLPVALRYRPGLVLMHMQGEPETMQDDPQYDDVVDDVYTVLASWVKALIDANVDIDTISIDPGIGFGKTVTHNIECLTGLERLRRIGRPLLVGASRKIFLGRITGRPVAERLSGSLGAAAYALTRGAHLLRVHDVRETRDVAKIVDAFLTEEKDDVFMESTSTN